MSDDRAATGALAEFAAVRAEMDSRSKYQQQIVALQLSLTSAIFAFALSQRGLVGILMIVPLSSYLLCGRYVGQRNAIRWASRYIEERLSPRVAGGLEWTSWTRENRRPDRLIDWLLPMLICFPGASALALGWTFQLFTQSTDRSILTTVGIGLVWAVGLLATVTSTFLLARVYFDRVTRG